MGRTIPRARARQARSSGLSKAGEARRGTQGYREGVLDGREGTCAGPAGRRTLCCNPSPSRRGECRTRPAVTAAHGMSAHNVTRTREGMSSRARSPTRGRICVLCTRLATCVRARRQCMSGFGASIGTCASHRDACVRVCREWREEMYSRAEPRRDPCVARPRTS